MTMELRLLLRSKFGLLALLGMLLLSSAALYSGLSVIEQQNQQIERALSLQQQQRVDQLKAYGSGGDAGSAGYYVFHVVVDKPLDWSFISIGNRDVLPVVQRVRLLGLQAQLYDGEAHNAERVIGGSFDYAFVIIFLLPLLCIALCHNLFTVEKEQQRLSFLQALVNRSALFWSRRVFVRWLIALLSVLLPFWLLAIYKQLDLDVSLVISVLAALYAAFWCVLSALLSLWQRAASSVSNAMLLLSVWLVLTIVAPSMANVGIAQLTPMPKSAEIALAHRKKVNDAWDLPKETTFNEFFKYHPEWQGTPPVTGRFHWKWYYAFHHVADMSVQADVAKQQAVLMQRHTYTQALGTVLPSIAAQNILDSIADNGLPRLLSYRQAVTRFHTELRLYFYPYVFNEKPFNKQDFLGMPEPDFIAEGKHGFIWQLVALAWVSVVILLIFLFLLRRKI